jgi:fluoride ion exporter CrcB/FEX
MATHTNLTARQLLLAVVVVAAGGALGTLLRDVALKINTAHWYTQLVGTSGWASRVPWVLVLINLVGVYCATAALKGPLVRHDPNNLTRLVVITGFFGGFTSYSSLFVSLGSIWHLSVVGAVLTGAAVVLTGALVAWLGARSWSR